MKKAFKPADILLPNSEKIDFTKWAVVACDQYTSEPEYWKETENIVNGSPSTLNMILPEIYLNDSDVEKRIEKIHENMKKYLGEGVFTEYKDALVLVKRTQSDGKVISGIVGMFDLEEYDYKKGSRSQIRATEATVKSRIPPRVKIRQDALLELPHIMILIDDENKTVIEPSEEKISGLKKLYDFELMQNGGHLEGYLLDDESKAQIFDALEALGDKEKFNEKYNLENEEVLLFAMGDGNHSLATAKEFYEMQKAKNPDAINSPSRYALAEIVNLHSDGLVFEAIHRIVMDVDVDGLKKSLFDELEISTNDNGSDQKFYVVENGEATPLWIGNPTSQLTVGSVQNFLDKYVLENGGEIDYIHGKSVIEELSKKERHIGFLFEDMDKKDLYPTVIKDGALPRKTFSMGHANDKRYYMEARKITL